MKPTIIAGQDLLRECFQEAKYGGGEASTVLYLQPLWLPLTHLIFNILVSLQKSPPSTISRVYNTFYRLPVSHGFPVLDKTQQLEQIVSKANLLICKHF